MPTGFQWQNGMLHGDDVPLARIAQCYGTPFYCYSQTVLENSYRAFAAACAPVHPLICYAVKANSNLAVIRCFAALGAGADVVSAGELQRALMAGIPASKIIFSGVGKSTAEIRLAALAGLYQFNVESLPELRLIAAVGDELGQRLPIALRINPDVDPRTHAKISTGTKESKFGISLTQLDEALALITRSPMLNLCGLAVHIGSQLTSLEPFDAAFGLTASLIADLRARGHAISRVDVGGGLGIRYQAETPPDVADYAALVQRHFGTLGLQICLEPGRSLVGEAGVLVSRVLYAKHGVEKNFLILDAAMNDLLRPALYNAWHNIIPVQESAAPLLPWDVVGPVCETGDLFGTNRMLPALQAEELVAITCAGAYGASMASTYNSRPLIAEFMVKGDCFSLIRRALPPEEQIQWDVTPVWSR
jgi:diaminopimelate decarboxylase